MGGHPLLGPHTSWGALRTSTLSEKQSLSQTLRCALESRCDRR
ncbi:hypothetical protein NP493_609g01000 [Ridgeia piscesae]|uniref:Uncharacterized protein n=1 Tax=Ridgeia piscesae TaxID=27915 RepID=A0AAD9KUR2_RIDPI|nr:hypothetical protein NP493_609g01000 [Ridgeia piscesae]